MVNSIKAEKVRLRDRVWREMEVRRVAAPPLPCRNRIPNFKGVEKACEKLRELADYRKASAIFISPDYAQFHARRLALADGKTVVMASPRLKAGFIVIDPNRVSGKEALASTIKGAFQYGELTDSPPKVNLIIEGSVAVDEAGNRLGKGGGYGDLEIKMIRKKWGNVKVATICHSMQIVERVPTEEKDEKVDYIITEKEIIQTTKDLRNC